MAKSVVSVWYSLCTRINYKVLGKQNKAENKYRWNIDIVPGDGCYITVASKQLEDIIPLPRKYYLGIQNLNQMHPHKGSNTFQMVITSDIKDRQEEIFKMCLTVATVGLQTTGLVDSPEKIEKWAWNHSLDSVSWSCLVGSRGKNLQGTWTIGVVKDRTSTPMEY